MSTLKVDTIATRTGSGNITASNTIAGTSATLSGTLGVTGASTLTGNVGVNGGTGGQVAVNYSTASTTGLKLNDTNSGNLGGFVDFRSGSGAGTQRATIQNANNTGIHVNVGTGGSVCFTNVGYTAANALDDYEEGTFTPTFGGTSGNPTVSYSVQLGTYVKIGKIVQVTASVIASGTPNGGAGDLQVKGLPFTGKAGIQQAGSVGFTNNLSTASGTTQMGCNIEGGVSYINVNVHEYSGTSSMGRATPSALHNSSPRIVVTLCYETD
tara:strand:+ start:511 stop:1314 length:804 start_codon:yes stop_codon:yes gene_type:complete